MPYSSTSKDPNAVLDFQFDWSTHLGSDTISSYSFPSFPTGITKDSDSRNGNVITIWLSGGTNRQDYLITNRVVTTGGRTEDWILIVRVGQFSVIPTGPPYAAITEHVAYTPMAEGEEAFKVEMVALDASDIVQQLVPSPPVVEGVLSAAMDAAQTTVPVTESLTEPFPSSGEILIGSEVISYSGRAEYSSTLTGARRGAHASVAATHASGDAVREVGYALRARRAELAVFEWLFSTRGWRPSRSGVLGSEAYSIGDEVKQVVRQIMGPYYGRKGGAIRKSVPMTNFPRKSKTPYDWQMGWYDI